MAESKHNAGHSPLPWTGDEHYPECVMDAEGTCIAEMDEHDVPLVVKAANAHDKLVEMVREMAAELECIQNAPEKSEGLTQTCLVVTSEGKRLIGEARDLLESLEAKSGGQSESEVRIRVRIVELGENFVSLSSEPHGSILDEFDLGLGGEPPASWREGDEVLITIRKVEG